MDKYIYYFVINQKIMNNIAFNVFLRNKTAYEF